MVENIRPLAAQSKSFSVRMCYLFQNLVGHYPEAGFHTSVNFRANILAEKGMQKLRRHT
jgi:hypothetical protein